LTTVLSQLDKGIAPLAIASGEVTFEIHTPQLIWTLIHILSKVSSL
jgi:hypothetical protein